MTKILQKLHISQYLNVLGVWVMLLFVICRVGSAQTTIFYENFDGTYSNTTINGGGSTLTNASCIPTSQVWTGATTCTSCLGGFSPSCYYFYRDDQNISSNADKCGGGGTYSASPCTEAGSYAIYFDAYDVNNQTATVISPTIDLSAYNSSCYTVNFSFYYSDQDEGTVQVLFSNNGGTSFASPAPVANYTFSNTGNNLWHLETVSIPVAYCVNNFKVEFIATSAYNYYPIGIDEVSITESSSAPTTNATLNAYTGVTCTGTTVNWTDGNGADRIVVAYPNSTITPPVSGTAYAANTTYGSGAALGAGYVVYSGTGATSVAVTGLTQTTTYYYAVFEYNGAHCYLTPGVSSNQATTSCCPTTAASAINFSNVSCTGMTVNWTSGNGSSEIVVAYPTVAITNPTNGTTYTANTTYGSGTGLGLGYVVYAGASGVGTVNVTGLAANTKYYFAVFEYNTVACYYTAGAPSANQTTSSPPTTAASAVIFSGVGCNGMTLTWTNGNGADRIVVAYPTAVYTAPSSGTTYTANAAYGIGTALGAGFVVYSGASNTVTVSGLSENTTYYFAVYEYNGNSCYYTVGAPTANHATTGPPTVAASAITFSGVGCNGMTLNWTNGNGTDRIVVAYPTAVYTAPTMGTVYTANAAYASGSSIGAGYVVYSGAGNSVTISGLSENTTYYFAVFEYNCTSTYLIAGPPTANHATTGPPTVAASGITFSGVACNGMTVSWTNGNGTDRIVVAYPTAVYTAPTLGTAYTANTAYASGSSIGAGYVVYAGAGSTVTISGLSGSTTYYFAVFEYNCTSTYLTAAPPTANHATTACPCPTTQATALTYSNVNCSSLTVSWTNGNGADRLVVAYPNSTITSPTNSTIYTANTAYGSGTAVGAGFVIYNGTGNTVSITGLTTGTTYYFAVFEYNTTSCYLTPGLSSSQATTAACCPTTAASNIKFSHIGCNSLVVNWTNGNGADRIVVAFPSSTITNPTNGTTYTANYTYGSGTAIGAGSVVYNGSGSTVTVLGLSTNTKYYFAIFEYTTTSCYQVPGASSNYTTASSCVCPYMSTAATDGCNTCAANGGGCTEGDSEYLLLNTCSYGWDNTVVAPTINYGSDVTAFTTYTVSGTADYMAQSATVATMNASNAACNGEFIAASDPTHPVAIPPWSYVLFCAAGAGNQWCGVNCYDFSGICPSGPIYVIFGHGGLQASGNYVDHTAGATRYFETDFSPITGGPCDDFYTYDAGTEANGDGAYETYTAPISTAGTDAAATAPTTYGQSCSLTTALLPITLVSFIAQPDNNVVNLSWQTQSETNNKLFTVEKSTDGLSWVTVTTVAGAGNSDQLLDYSAVDESPYPNTSYYRLKQTDIDGHSTYSHIVAVNMSSSANIMTLVPNPATNITYVTFNSVESGSAQLTISDLTGRAVDTKQLNVQKGTNSTSLDVSKYTNGLYFITVNTSAQQLSSKLVVNH